MGIVLKFGSMADNLSHVTSEGTLRAVIFFTPQTVTMDEAIPILKKRNIEVFDVRLNPTDSWA